MPIATAHETAVRVLTGLGWDAQAANVQADIMLFAELHGNNQGLVKLLDPSQMAPQAGMHMEQQRALPAVHRLYRQR